MAEYQNGNPIFEEPEEGINIKAILGIVRIYWLLFVVSIATALVISFLITRYTTPVYQIQAQILLANEQEGREGADILGVQGFGGGFNPWDPTFVNDKIQIMKSVRFIEPLVIDSLSFTEAYYEQGDIKTSERYGDQPFRVNFSRFNENMEESTFAFDFDNKEYHLNVSKGDKIYLDKTYAFDDSVVHENFAFTLQSSATTKAAGKTLGSLDGHRFEYKRFNARQMVKNYAGRLNISQVKNTKALELSIEETVPQKGIDFLNAVSRAFVNKGLDDKNQGYTNSLRFINEELGRISDTLRRYELDIEFFKKSKGMVSIPEQTTGLITEWSDLEVRKYEQQLNVKNIQNLRTYLDNNTDYSTLAPATFGITDPLLIPLIQGVSDAYEQFAQISRGYKPETQEYKTAKLKVQSARARLLENARNIENQAQKLLKEYGLRLSQIDQKINNVPAIQRQFIGLERKFSVQEKLYLLLLEKKFEYEIARSGNKSDYSILNEAFSAKQTKPDKKRNIVLAFVLGLFVPSAYLFLKIFFDNKVRSREQIESRAEIPFLAAIPHYSGKGSLVFDQNSKSMVAESFRNLRTSVQYFIKEKEQQGIRLMLTSTVGGEGKTFLTLNLAHVLAMSDKKVIVLGLDLRKPRLHLSFDIKNDVGMTTYLSGRTDLDSIIKSTGIPHIDIIPSGPVPPNPSELLLSKEMQDLLRILSSRYDYVLMDTAPMGLVTDAVDLLPFADLTLYVLRENYTNRSAIDFANQFYKNQARGKLGIVLNDSTFSGAKYGYGSKYGYGYSYGYGYGYGYGYVESYGYYSEEDRTRLPWWKKLLP